MQYLLYIDTATDAGTVAVSDGGNMLASRTNEESRNHAGTINTMVADVVAEAGITLTELSGVVVCAGPGSYTGLRIGLATAKGFCYALNKPLILDNRLTLLAYHAWKEKDASVSQIVTLLHAREKEYFISIYDESFTCVVQPQHILHGQLDNMIDKKQNTLIVTNVSTDIANEFVINNLQVVDSTNINLNSWASYAFEEYKCNKIVNLSEAEPFYLKQVYTHK